MSPLVVGVGNSDRGDDGIGPWVASKLAERGIEVIACRGETTELMQCWEGRADVIVVDAMRSGAAAGTLLCIDPADGPFPTAAFTGSTHAFGLAEAIELCRALGVLPPGLLVYGIEGSRFGIGEDMSEQVLAAGAELVELLANEKNHA